MDRVQTRSVQPAGLCGPALLLWSPRPGMVGERDDAAGDAAIHRRSSRGGAGGLGAVRLRDQTRREHVAELQDRLGWQGLTNAMVRPLRDVLLPMARTSDKLPALVAALIDELRQQRVVMPSIERLEWIAASARHRARREAYAARTAELTQQQRTGLDGLLERHREQQWRTTMGWLREPPGAAASASTMPRSAAMRHASSTPSSSSLRRRRRTRSTPFTCSAA